MGLPDTTTALLLMDLQRGILTSFEADGDFVDRINAAAATARASGIHVVYVQLAFRPATQRSVRPTNASRGSLRLGGLDRVILVRRSTNDSGRNPVTSL